MQGQRRKFLLKCSQASEQEFRHAEMLQRSFLWSRLLWNVQFVLKHWIAALLEALKTQNGAETGFSALFVGGSKLLDQLLCKSTSTFYLGWKLLSSHLKSESPKLLLHET